MKLKRMLVIAVALVLVCTTAVIPALAASGINENEQAIYDKLAGGVKIGSTTVYVFDDRLSEVNNFFNRDDVDVTAEEKDEIIAFIDACYAVASYAAVIEWAESGKTSLSELPREVKQIIIENGAAASEVLGLNFSYNSANNGVTITDANGVLLTDCKAVVKGTGSVDYTAIIIAAVALAAVLAVATFVALRKRANVAA